MTNIKLLFRYRDILDKETLERHREIIHQHGWCWWGWWHRPAEDPHFDLWNELQAEVSRSGEAWVGLFNSDPETGGEVHRAKVVGVKPPTRADDGRIRIPILEDDAQVPQYYRATPFSSAWLKLTEIQGAPIEKFFLAYSYRDAPELARIESSALKRFKGKKVVDAEELRMMDTTMWSIRGARGTDSADRILATSSRVAKAHSREPIALSGNRVLHLSDIHFATGARRDQHAWGFPGERSDRAEHRVPLLDSITSALGKDHEIGLVVISGDISLMAGKDEFYEAFRFIHGLLGFLGLGVEHLVIVPGNHDIARAKQEDEGWDASRPVESAPAEAEQEYRTFYQRIFRHHADDALSMARRFITPEGRVLDIACLNSSSLVSGKKWLAGMGRVAGGAFAKVSETLGWESPTTAALRLLVLHHHLMVVEDIMPTSEFDHGFGMASDARNILRDAAKRGVQLVLHGHRHRPFLGREHVYPDVGEAEAGELGTLTIVGAGSAGSKSVRDGQNFFNVFEIAPDHIKLKWYWAKLEHQHRQDFSLKDEWRAECSQAEGRLTLGPWRRL